ELVEILRARILEPVDVEGGGRPADEARETFVRPLGLAMAAQGADQDHAGCEQEHKQHGVADRPQEALPRSTVASASDRRSASGPEPSRWQRSASSRAARL